MMVIKLTINQGKENGEFRVKFKMVKEKMGGGMNTRSEEQRRTEGE